MVFILFDSLKFRLQLYEFSFPNSRHTPCTQYFRCFASEMDSRLGYKDMKLNVMYNGLWDGFRCFCVVGVSMGQVFVVSASLGPLIFLIAITHPVAQLKFLGDTISAGGRPLR